VVEDGDGHLVMAAEAIHPPFVAAQPRAAGVAGVVTVLNDLAATGARPIALLDCVVGGSLRLVEDVLEGLRIGGALYGVPIVGGHTTTEEGAAPGLSTFAVGRAAAPLAARNARAGDAGCLAACREGEMMVGAGSSFFSHLRGPRRDRARDDLDLLAEAAEAGETWAARDVSMPGVAGSLLQLCESAGGLGCSLDLDALPVPAGLAMERWILTVPSYGFLLVGDPDPLAARFGAAGLTLARLGTRDGTGLLRRRAGGRGGPGWGRSRDGRSGLRPPAP
jgi:selenophosphate synthetase-related protein